MANPTGNSMKAPTGREYGGEILVSELRHGDKIELTGNWGPEEALETINFVCLFPIDESGVFLIDPIPMGGQYKHRLLVCARHAGVTANQVAKGVRMRHVELEQAENRFTLVLHKPWEQFGKKKDSVMGEYSIAAKSRMLEVLVAEQWDSLPLITHVERFMPGTYSYLTDKEPGTVHVIAGLSPFDTFEAAVVQRAFRVTKEGIIVATVSIERLIRARNLVTYRFFDVELTPPINTTDKVRRGMTPNTQIFDLDLFYGALHVITQNHSAFKDLGQPRKRMLAIDLNIDKELKSLDWVIYND